MTVALLLAALAAAAPLQLTAERSLYPLSEAQLIVDEGGGLTIEALRALEAKGRAPWKPAAKFNFGYSTAPHWLKLTVANSAAEEHWLLQLGYPLIQRVDFHQYRRGREVSRHRTGKLLPFDSRPIRHHLFLFEFAAPRGEAIELYLRVQSNGTLLAPLSISTKEAMLARSGKTTIGIGVYVGIILAMVLYNLFLFLAFRDRNYLLYVVYAATFCLLLCTLNGLSYQYLWPRSPGWNKVSVPVIVGVCYLFLALFTRSLLETRRLTPRLDRGLDLVVAGALFLVVGPFVSYGLFVNRFTSLFISAVPFIVIPVSAACARRGSTVAVYYLIAFGCFFAGSATHALRDLGWLPQNFVTANGPYLGSAAEMLLLSLALAARVKTLREDKLRSELQTAEARRELADSREELARQLAVSQLASQVAHDIRSPLAALEVIERDLSALAEAQRVLVRGAVGRIRDIAESLLRRDREIRAAVDEAAGLVALSGGGEPARVELLSSLVESLVSEKRLQFRGKEGVEVSAAWGEGSYGLFARVPASELKRALSNLVNNAVEALGEAGRVTVELSGAEREAVVRVRDDGKGIPPEVLPLLGARGATHGKAGGHGLGLSHAKAGAEGWGGSLELESEPGKGTTVSLRLPRAEAPSWFVPVLSLGKGEVVVVDDDEAIHELWRQRLSPLGLSVRHLRAPAELRALPGGPDAFYLIDHEFEGEAATGLDLVCELGLAASAVLVTSRHEEPELLERCESLGLPVLPKSLAALVPLSAAPKGGGETVLLDGDPLVHLTWKLAAKSRGASFTGYRTAAELLAAAASLPKDARIYLDSQLGGGQRGEDVAKELHALGFRDLYLATGRAPESLPPMPWLRGVVGKAPPWSS